ncbi:MAG TPA: 50S ribosomal protein L10 [Acidimicrobiales bacterium]|nr:50S ribosomal protein L10 [Acidimicrobiales bacterium]
MDNPRPEKVAVVDEVRERLTAADAAILTEYRGLSVKDLAALRRSLAPAGGTYKIYKNTLVSFAVRDLGLAELEAMLQGPTAIAFVDGDAVEVAKALRDFSRTHPLLVVKGGILGQSVLSPADAAALADVPPREVLLARIAGAFAAPMVQFAGLLEALPRNLAYGLKALLEKRGGAPEAAADAPAEDAVDAAAAPGDSAADATGSAAAPPAVGAGEAAPAESAVGAGPVDSTPAEPADSTPTPESPAEGSAEPAPADAAPPADTAEPAAPADAGSAAAEPADAAAPPADTAEPAAPPAEPAAEPADAAAPADAAPADAGSVAAEPAGPADEPGPSTAGTEEPAEGATDPTPPAADA